MNIAGAAKKSYTRLERQLLAVAEAMPPDRYAFRPTPEVRTFGEQLRHVAAVQWFVGATLLHEDPPVDVGDGDSGPLSMTAKPEILKYAQESFDYFCHAINSTDTSNALEMIPHPYDPNLPIERLALIVSYVGHGWEHYGQMIVYQRLNHIIPPPSRSS